jgi:spore germination cell wall hydrolase CwlJ-like protein
MSEKSTLFRIGSYLLVLLLGVMITSTANRYTLVETTEEITPEVKVAKVVDPKQLACLAKNIYFEAGGEPLLGQAAVARVVMNRIRHGFGSNPCSVIYQSTVVNKETDEGEMQKVKLCQFSWVCEGKSDPNTKSPRYQQAKQVAYDVLAHDAYADVVPKSTLFFHSVSVAPGWAYNKVKKIGNHIFYSKEKKKVAREKSQ